MDYISTLIHKYLVGRHSSTIEMKVQQWLTEEKNSEEKNRALQKFWNSIEPTVNNNTYRSLAKINQILGINKPAKKIRLNIMLRIAAGLLPLLLMTAVCLYVNRDIQMIEVVTKYGERKEIVLPDSSKVWLTAGSKLIYPERFVKTRTMRLSGEAYFSVTKNPSKPFEVVTEKLTVQVLGTEFNVTAYPDDDKTTTALALGKIQVSIHDGQQYILTPGQQLSLCRDSVSPSVINVLQDDIAAKRNGCLVFDNATLAEIIRVVERHYDVSIKVQGINMSGDRYSIKFTNNENIEHLMIVLEDIAGKFTWTIHKKQ